MPRSLPLRAEQLPDDAVVVIRGGVLRRTHIERAARRSFAVFGVLAISLEGVIGATVLRPAVPAIGSRATGTSTSRPADP